MYKDAITANTILNRYNINVVFTEKINLTEMEANNIKTIDYRIAVDVFFNYLSVGQIPQTAMNLAVKKCYDELKEYRLLDSEIKTILLEVYGNKKAYNRVLLGYKFRFSMDKSVTKIRKEIFSAFKVKSWYSSTEIFQTISDIVNENGGKCESKNKASEIFNFLFEVDETFKNIEGKNTRGYIIKQTK